MADFSDQLVPTTDLAVWISGEQTLEDDNEMRRASYIIHVASAWAREVSGKAWTDLSAVPVTVKGIVLAGSRREYENPKHVTYEVQGPESASYNQLAYPPGFYTDPEVKALRRYRLGGGLFTLRTYRDDPSESLGYLYATDLSKPIPMYNPWEPGWEDSVHL